jgi:hypothetical protein
VPERCIVQASLPSIHNMHHGTEQALSYHAFNIAASPCWTPTSSCVSAALCTKAACTAASLALRRARSSTWSLCTREQ